MLRAFRATSWCCKGPTWRTVLMFVVGLYVPTLAGQPTLDPTGSIGGAVGAVAYAIAKETGSKTGVGLGQLACGDFSRSAERLRPGTDDGLYHAFLAWRDGFVTASADFELRPILTSKEADRWLSAYCREHPEARFAQAVVTAVRQLSGVRTALLTRK